MPIRSSKITKAVSDFRLVMKAPAKQTENVTNFLNEYKAGTQIHPFNQKARVWKDAIVFEIHPYQGMISLDSIFSMDGNLQGLASQALKWFCSIADKAHVNIKLIAAPFGRKSVNRLGRKPLNKSELVQWYKRNGFKVDKTLGVDILVRPFEDRGKTWPT